MKRRVQHSKVHERKDRKGSYWFFRYWHDEMLPDGQIKPSRKFHTIGPSKGEGALTRRQAEIKRDDFLSEVNAAPTKCDSVVQAQHPIDIRAIIFGNLAELWRKDYVDNPKVKLATPTREKYRSRLDTHILPRWKATRLGEFRAKEILDWLQNECSSWHMMTDLRNIMSGIFARAQEWEILDESFANPMARVKVGKSGPYGRTAFSPKRRPPMYLLSWWILNSYMRDMHLDRDTHRRPRERKHDGRLHHRAVTATRRLDPRDSGSDG